MDTIYEGYFDESAAGPGQKIFCLGGYVIDSAIAPKMSAGWSTALQKYGVSMFHMKDCAPGVREFKKINKEDRSKLVSELIGLIHEFTSFGFTVSINISQYENNPGPKHPTLGTIMNYMQVCALVLVAGVAIIMTEENLDGTIKYNFESGHALQRSANSFINYMLMDKKAEYYRRHAGHAYRRKDESVLLQAADLLVWLNTKNMKNVVIRQPDRKDYLALTAGGKHFAYNVFVKDGVLNIGEITPYFEGDPRPGWEALRQLHAGETPTVRLPGLRFDGPGKPIRRVFD